MEIVTVVDFIKIYEVNGKENIVAVDVDSSTDLKVVLLINIGNNGTDLDAVIGMLVIEVDFATYYLV